MASGLNENLFALMWLLKYVWPPVLAAHPSASLSICGNICEPLQQIVKAENSWLGSLADLHVLIEGRKG